MTGARGEPRPRRRPPIVLPASRPRAPYRGIEPFRVVDRAIFSGRTEEVEDIVAGILTYRAFLVYGDTGVGKSSLINAGVIPSLLQRGFVPHRVRVQPKAGEEFIIERVPVEEEELDRSGAVRAARCLPSVLAGEAVGPLVLSTEALGAAVARAAQSNALPVLIFDQLEELVTLFERDRTSDTQMGIVRCLIGVVRNAGLPVKVLLSFREDYFTKIRELFADLPQLSDQYFRVTAPPIGCLDEMISGPFHSKDLDEHHFDLALSPALCGQLSTELTQRWKEGPVRLTEAQISCLMVWKAPDGASLLAQGVPHLITEYYASALDELEGEEMAVAITLLAMLVTPARTRNVVSESELVKRAQHLVRGEGAAGEQITRVLRKLEQGTRVVRHERRDEERFYEIVSEFLIDWILERDADLKARREAEEKVKQARREVEEREARRRARLMAWAFMIVGGVVVAFLVHLGYDAYQRTLGNLNTWKNKFTDEKKRSSDLQRELDGSLDAGVNLREQLTDETGVAGDLNRRLDGTADAGALWKAQLEAEKKTAAGLGRALQDSHDAGESWKEQLADETRKLHGETAKVEDLARKLQDSGDAGASLQKQLDDASRQSAERQRQLEDSRDAGVSLHKQLSDQQGRLSGELDAGAALRKELVEKGKQVEQLKVGMRSLCGRLNAVVDAGVDCKP